MGSTSKMEENKDLQGSALESELKAKCKIEGIAKFEEENSKKIKSTEIFECTICGKRFKSLLGHKNHQSIHTYTEASFKCDSCEKSFFSKLRLKVHEKIHTSEKSFKCESCNRSFLRIKHFEKSFKDTHWRKTIWMWNLWQIFCKKRLYEST